jgi:hypothetical protein
LGHDLSRLAGGPPPAAYRETPKADRTPVYLLAGQGVVSILLGVVCYYIEANREG